MANLFVQSETQLFKYRFACFNQREILHSIRALRKFKHLAAQSQVALPIKAQDIINLLNAITSQYKWETLVTLYLEGCDESHVTVPFQYVLDLVAKRSVVLKTGLAYVPCSKLCDILESLYKAMLEHGMDLAKKQWMEAAEDDRIKRIFRDLKVFFKKTYPNRSSLSNSVQRGIRCEELDEVSTFFPLCMKHLHTSLRKRHRLRHFSRIQYTLFLKEAGLPINEAIQLWKQEYSQHCPDESKSSCSHNWQKDSKRYTYNIRHLYGLEGSRTNYRAHCCQSIQHNNPGPGEEGGCPFKHFDIQCLKQSFCQAGINYEHQDLITNHIKAQNYSSACGAFLQAQLCTNASIEYKQLPPGNSGHQRIGSSTTAKNECTESGTETETETSLHQKHQSVFKHYHSKSDVHRSVEAKRVCLDMLQKSTVSDKRLGSESTVLDCTKSKALCQHTFEANIMTTQSAGNTQQSCYDHNVCPPSQEHASQSLQPGDSGHSEQLIFHKPIDFYASFNKLYRGLKRK